MNWFESEGTLIYDPHGRAAKSRQKVSEPWWLLLMCDNGIVDYYNYWLKKRGIYTFKYSLYGSHVSIIKGEEPPNKNVWKKYHRKKITFRYNNFILDNGIHWWIWARSKVFREIRGELGLSRKPNFKFHLTIGRKIS